MIRVTLDELLESERVSIEEDNLRELIDQAIEKVLDPEAELVAFDVSKGELRKEYEISVSYNGWQYQEIEVHLL